MLALYNTQAPKRATNLSINGDLLQQAREMKINLSAVLEQTLVERVKQARQAQWLAENRQAIAAYNEDVDKNGVFSDGLRRF